MEKNVIVRVVAGVLLICYLAAAIYGVAPTGDQLVQLMIVGAIALLFGDALRKYKQQIKGN